MFGCSPCTADSAVIAVGPPIMFTLLSPLAAATPPQPDGISFDPCRQPAVRWVIRWTPRIHPIMATQMSTCLSSLCRQRRHAICCCCLVPRCGVCGLDKHYVSQKPYAKLQLPDAWHGVWPADSADVPASAALSYCTLSCGWAGRQRPRGTALSFAIMLQRLPVKLRLIFYSCYN